MKNRTIGQLIIGCGAILLGLIVVIGGAALLGFRNVAIHSDALTSDVMPGILASASFNQDLEEEHIALLDACRATADADRASCLAHSDDQFSSVGKSFEDYAGQINDAEDRANYEALRSDQAAYASARQALIAAIQSKNPEAVNKALPAAKATFSSYAVQAAKVLDWNMKSGEELSASARAMKEDTHRLSGWITALCIVAFVAGSSLSLLIVRTVNRSLRSAATVLTDASVQITTATHTVSSASQALAEGSSRQAASVEQTSAAVEELNGMMARNADGARSAKALAAGARTSAESGARQMTELTDAMAKIKRASDNVGKILKSIDEIAFQTNILALNAAVEAARAGEAGAGFAVVAGEVRTLAQRAAEASRETAEKIDESIRSTQTGVEVSGRVAESFLEITRKAGEINAVIGEIASASSEQASGLDQISNAMSEIDKVTQDNAAAAEETASATEELNAQAGVLAENIRRLERLVSGTPKPSVVEPSNTVPPSLLHPASVSKGRPFPLKGVAAGSAGSLR